ncbi:MAG: mucoidy inhibitor MuiA family protein [Candidatus Freyarchaeum deiterrae]
MAVKFTDSEIDSVTVFRDGARVTRTASVTLESGTHVLSFEVLTPYIDTNSVRVKGLGKGALSNINVYPLWRELLPEGDLVSLLARKEELERQLREIQEEIQFYEGRVKQFSTLVDSFVATFPQFYSAGESTINTLTDLDSLTSEKILELKKIIREKSMKLKDVSDELQVVTNNIQKYSKSKTEQVYVVDVTIDAAQRSEFKVEMAYQTGGAAWTPVYDVNIENGNAVIRTNGAVGNRTREDWSNVQLTVSTATSKPAVVIEPQPYYIDVYRPPQPVLSKSARGAGGMPASAPKRDDGIMAKEKDRGEPMEREEVMPEAQLAETFATPEVALSGIQIYNVPGRVSIPADNASHPIVLTENTFPSERFYYWYSEAGSEVIAQDEITNGEGVLLSGRMKVFASGDYMGESSIGLISPGEKFKLGARFTYDVKVEKKLVAREAEKGGITKGKLRNEYKYRLKLNNYSSDKSKIELVDRIPHSLSPEIEAKITSIKPQPDKQELGILRWKLELNPGEETEVSYEYNVEWNRNYTVTGLP